MQTWYGWPEADRGSSSGESESGLTGVTADRVEPSRVSVSDAFREAADDGSAAVERTVRASRANQRVSSFDAIVEG